MADKLFERQPKEGAKAYACFQKFLDLGPDRTWKQVAAEMQIDEKKMRQVYLHWKWKDRALAWEEYLAAAQQQRAKKILEKDADVQARRRVVVREQEFEMSQKLMKRAVEMLEFPLTETKTVTELKVVNGHTIPIAVTIVKPVKCSPRDAAAVAQVASQLARMSVDMDTSHDTLTVKAEGNALQAQAQAALEKVRDEWLASEEAKNPLLREKGLKALPAWIGEQWNVDPNLLTVDGMAVSNTNHVDGQVVEEDTLLPIVEAELLESATKQDPDQENTP